MMSVTIARRLSDATLSMVVQAIRRGMTIASCLVCDRIHVLDGGDVYGCTHSTEATREIGR